MAGRYTPRTVLAHLIQRRNQTYSEIVAEFVELGGTITERHLRRLASGERAGTTPQTRRTLQRMFGKPVEELLAPYVPEPVAQVVPAAASGRITTGNEMEVLDMAASRARAFALAAQTGLGSEAMEQVYDDVRHVAKAYPQRPLPEILGQLVETQDLVFALLESRQRPEHLRQLYFLGGVTGGLLAKASHDLGNPHAALTQARTAFLCADNADHHGLRAWVRGLQSLVSYWAGNPHDSVRYAQLGAGYAEQANSTTGVWLPVSEARAWAALGNADAARAALVRAENAWGTVQADELDEMGGLCTFGRNRQLYYAADALAWLPGERETAEQYSRQAVDAYTDQSHPEWAFGDAAGSHAAMAITRIANGELEGAADALAPVLGLPTERRINGVVHSARRVHQALRQSGHGDDARDLQEEIEMFTRTPMQTFPQ
ncbi:XRE family transcriptional regulator [Streptomyces sp. SID13031]|uniref:XRE family transcriptional regulator n=1 Tax=Streptomyces sp. SID13031 TaxID=2706046 RepID=UPI0013C67F6F|nr:XRE family transcriptional regulator [Streptomyces sp. SID13031]NEA33241.1 XRE family transcriptional regulator [Streptomyces sp. SID13031]